jgi:hypothetical protein
LQIQQRAITIMLGPHAQQAWQSAGSPDPYCPGKIVDANTQITLEKNKQPSFLLPVYMHLVQ